VLQSVSGNPQKVFLFYRRKIMENFRDAELKKWLAEEYEKETEEMESAI
jgi:hypothetical protein